MNAPNVARSLLSKLRTPETRLNARRTPVAISPSAPHAVVVGAGFGGLAAAIRLLEDSTGELVKAIRGAGVYIPG